MAGLYLVGCGSSSEQAFLAGPTPNGFLFKNVLGPGSALEQGHTLDTGSTALNGAVQISDSGELVFQGKNDSGRLGAYRAQLDASHNLGPVEKILAVGDPLPDGSKVRLFSNGDIGPQGQWATIVADDRGGESVYLQSGAGQPLRQVARINDAIDGGVLGAGFTNLSLHSNEDMLLVAYYAPDGEMIPRQGLFLLPGSKRSSSRRLLATGNNIPESSDTVGMIGLPHLENGGYYAVGLTATRGNRRAGVGGSVSTATAVAFGQVSGVAPHLRAASPALNLTPAGPSSPMFVASTPLTGPRVQSGRLGLVLHDAPGQQRLVVDGITVTRAGDASPTGQTISGLYPPAYGASQALFSVLFNTQRQPELAMFSGGGAQTLLTAGDAIGDKVIRTFEFGAMTSQIDASGRMVMVSSYADKSRGLVVAIPV